LETSWEYAKDVFTCFVDLEKAYDRVPCEKLWGVLLEYGVDGSGVTDGGQGCAAPRTPLAGKM